jgi:site-specific recombinase XerD
MLVLTSDETRRLVAAIDRTEIWGLRNYALVVLLFNTGLRVGELCFLDADMVADPTTGRVRDVLSLPAEATKYNHGRLVPLNDRARQAISTILAWNAKYGFSTAAGCPLLVTRKHTRMSTRSVEALFANLRVKAGLDVQATPHSARHTMATTALACGGNVRALQTVLGHKRLASTEVYTHVNRDELKRTVDLVRLP